MLGLWTGQMTNCETLLCVYNQLPTMNTEDYVVCGILIFYVVGILATFYIAMKGDF